MKTIFLFAVFLLISFYASTQELLQKNDAYVRYLLEPCTITKNGLYHSKDSVHLFKQQVCFTNDIYYNPRNGWVNATVHYYEKGELKTIGYKGPGRKPLPKNFADYKKMIREEQQF